MRHMTNMHKVILCYGGKWRFEMGLSASVLNKVINNLDVKTRHQPISFSFPRLSFPLDLFPLFEARCRLKVFPSFLCTILSPPPPPWVFPLVFPDFPTGMVNSGILVDVPQCYFFVPEQLKIVKKIDQNQYTYLFFVFRTNKTKQITRKL